MINKEEQKNKNRSLENKSKSIIKSLKRSYSTYKSEKSSNSNSKTVELNDLKYKYKKRMNEFNEMLKELEKYWDLSDKYEAEGEEKLAESEKTQHDFYLQKCKKMAIEIDELQSEIKKLELEAMLRTINIQNF